MMLGQRSSGGVSFGKAAEYFCASSFVLMSCSGFGTSMSSTLS